MFIVKINRDAPFKRRARYAKVLKSWLYEIVEHLLFAALRINEIGIVFNEIFQLFLIFRKLEEISFFLSCNQFTSAIRAFTVNYLGFCKEAFARNAVETLVLAFVYISLFIKLTKNFLHYFFVIIIGSSYKLIICGIEKIAYVFYFTGYLVNIFLWRYACILGIFFDFLTMFISSGQEEYIISLHSLISRY